MGEALKVPGREECLSAKVRLTNSSWFKSSFDINQVRGARGEVDRFVTRRSRPLGKCGEELEFRDQAKYWYLVEMDYPDNRRL